jgi:prevent-host-death family protein
MTLKVSVAEVQSALAVYLDKALDEAVEVTRPGKEDVVIISAGRFRALKQSERRALHPAELTEAEAQAMANAEIPPEHRYSLGDIKS